MDAISAAPRTTPAPATPSAEAKPDSANKITSDFTTFLKMLTVQLRNQDPMNPVQSEDFAVQLATFSGVEQQVQTNALLEKLAGQQSAENLSQLTSWIGMEARSEGSVVFGGAPVTLFPSAPVGTERAELIVRDASGRVIDRSSIQNWKTSFEWSGRDARGNPYPAGKYDLSIEAHGSAGSLGVHVPEHYDLVKEARMEDGKAVVVFRNGSVAAAGDITSVRAPA